MVWYLGDVPVERAFLGAAEVAGAVSSKRLDGPDGIWSWWIYPQAENSGGFTRFGAVDSEGSQLVVEVDNDTLAVDSFTVSAGTYVDDDHNAPAVLTLSNGHLLVGYTGHNEDDILRWRISTTGMIADLGSEQTLQTQLPTRTTTYVQIMESPTTPGTVYWFTRIATNNWYVTTSTDYGATFGVERSVISTTNQYYGLFRPLPGRDLIRAFVYPHPRFAQNTLRVFDIDLSSLNEGLVITDGSGRGYLNGTAYAGVTLPMTEATIPALYTAAEADESIRLLATNNRGDMVAIAKFETAPPSTNQAADYIIGRLTGTNPHDADDWTWTTLISGVYPFGAGTRYYGGVEFETAPHGGYALYAAYMTAANAGTSRMERWTSDDGVTWHSALIRTAAHPERLIRPAAPVNADPRLALIWAQGLWTTYEVYDTTAKAGAVARRSTSLADLRWGIRALETVTEGGTAKFLLEWFGAPILEGATCTIDIAEGGTAAGADFSVTLDSAIATAISGLDGVSYDSDNNRLSLTHEAESPLVVSRAVASGDGTDDLETWSLTLSNASHGSIQIASSTTTLVDPLGAPLNGMSTGATAAWGFDRLYSLYDGPAIRLRRDSDDVESDFGFDGAGLLDAAAITTWLGGATGYGVTWYDQTGNGFHGAQATEANQPVYTASATPNSRPVWRFNGGTQCFVVPQSVAINNIFAGGGYACIGLRMQSAGGGSLGRAISKDGGSGGTGTIIGYFSTTSIRLIRAFTVGTRDWRSTVPTAGASAWAVYGVEYNSGASANLPVARVNSATSGSSGAVPGSETVSSDAPGDLIIGNRAAGDRGWDGDIFAACWFQDAPVLTDQEKVEDGIMAQYGVS